MFMILSIELYLLHKKRIPDRLPARVHKQQAKNLTIHMCLITKLHLSWIWSELFDTGGINCIINNGMFKHKPSFVVEWRYFPLLKDSLPKWYLSRSQVVMWELRSGFHPKPAPDQHRDCTVVIKTYCVYHIELHEQRYYFHNDVVLN